MSTYKPDSWVPIVIESEKYGKVYKILASWYGGYCGSDHWKVSSGVESISVSADGKVLTMPQASGSVYVVPKETHVSMLMGSIFTDYQSAAEENNFTIKMIEVNELLEAYKDKVKHDN